MKEIRARHKKLNEDAGCKQQELPKERQVRNG